MGLAVAAVVTLVLTPVWRRVALATHFLDLPAERKAHREPVPYLGGIAVAAGVAAGIATAAALGSGTVPQPLLGLAAAGVVGGFGLLDDRFTVPSSVRVVVQLAVAVLTVAAGVQVVVTGHPGVDTGLTVLWIVGIVNAINLSDNMDGLAGGLALVAAAGTLALALMAGQVLVAAVAAAVVGACVGWLAHNLPPARIYLGDAGSLLLGYLLAVITIEVTPAVAPPTSFAVPLLLLAVPVVDTTVVTFDRLAHARSPAAGGTDHLSHRLVARGLSPPRAVAVLVGVQAVCAAVAVALGRARLPLWGAALVAVPVLLVVVVPALAARVYAEPRSPRARLVATVAGVAAVAVALSAGWLTTRPPATVELAVSTERVIPGGTVAVEAGGFPPGGEVEVRLGTLVLDRTTADPQGRIAVEVVIPAEVAGGEWQLAAVAVDDPMHTAVRAVTVDGAEAEEPPGWVGVLAVVGAVGASVAVYRRRRL